MIKTKLIIKFFMIICLILIMFSSKENTTLGKNKTLKGEENGCLALNYHRVREDTLIDKLIMIFSNSKELKIYSVTNTQFESHIKWLKEHDANFLTLEEVIRYKEKGRFPSKCVWINFDDMDESIYKNAFPIMKKYDVYGTGFVITGEVGSSDFHNIKLSSKKHLREMRNTGLWNFATHTHRMHTMKKKTSILKIKANQENIKNDINKSTRYIKEELDGNTLAIAYPYGQTNQKIVNQLKEYTSIKYGFTLEERAMVPEDDNFYIPRIMVSDDAFNKLVKKWKGFNNE